MAERLILEDQSFTLPHLNYNGSLVLSENAPALIEGSVFRHETGLFESILCINNRIQLLPDHSRRLLHGMRQLYFDVPEDFSEKFFEKEIQKTILANPPSEYSRIRLQVFSEGNKTNFIIETIPIETSVFHFNQQGLVLGLAERKLKDFDNNGNLKTINLSLYKNAPAIAEKNNWDDVLLLDGEFIVESGSSNIFWIKDETIYTTPLSEGCIAGVMRKYIWTKYPVNEKRISKETLFSADEVFLTNAIRRIKWVRYIEGRHYNNYLTKEIYASLFS